MTTPVRQKVVIVGGGTAGWMAAAAMSKQLGLVVDIELVESDEIGTIGVGEATIPPIRIINSFLGIDEAEFMRMTSATYKLGISFENWGDVGQKYFHSFGTIGQESFFADFHHFWLKGKEKGYSHDIGEYCLEHQAALLGKFGKSKQIDVNYAYHLDATAYAKFLRQYAEKRGVKRTNAKVVKVHQHADNGFIRSVELDSGKSISGDYFIDCSGFRGLLIEQTLNTGYEDWSHWLPCDTAYAAQTESTQAPLPYTRSIAHKAGWQWRIPLQHRTGNGIVFSSRYMSDLEAKEILVNSVDGALKTEPRKISFRTGRRLKVWNKNCVAIGLSSGFVEPLESTSIQLIMSGIIRFIRLFPGVDTISANTKEYNQQTQQEIEKIRDFIILHYHTTQRSDSPFWRHCKDMELPQTLQHRISLFAQNAHAMQFDGELFRVDSWVQVMLGQGIEPAGYHQIVNVMSDEELKKFLDNIHTSINTAVSKMPDHAQYLAHYCKAE